MVRGWIRSAVSVDDERVSLSSSLGYDDENETDVE